MVPLKSLKIYSEINIPALPSVLELGSKFSEHKVESDPNDDKMQVMKLKMEMPW